MDSFCGTYPISDPARRGRGLPLSATPPDVGAWRPRMTRSRAVSPAPFGPISPVNSPDRTMNETSRKTLPAAGPDPDAVQPEQFVFRGREHYRCSVETLSVTALFRALISAIIQDW